VTEKPVNRDSRVPPITIVLTVALTLASAVWSFGCWVAPGILANGGTHLRETDTWFLQWMVLPVAAVCAVIAVLPIPGSSKRLLATVPLAPMLALAALSLLALQQSVPEAELMRQYEADKAAAAR
jgi:peptidoglycan/LPS O-acetylase OafA/YrhL